VQLTLKNYTVNQEWTFQYQHTIPMQLIFVQTNTKEENVKLFQLFYKLSMKVTTTFIFSTTQVQIRNVVRLVSTRDLNLPANKLILEFPEFESQNISVRLIGHSILPQTQLNIHFKNLVNDILLRPGFLHKSLFWSGQGAEIKASLHIDHFADSLNLNSDHITNRYACAHTSAYSPERYFFSSEVMTTNLLAQVHNMSIQIFSRTDLKESKLVSDFGNELYIINTVAYVNYSKKFSEFKHKRYSLHFKKYIAYNFIYCKSLTAESDKSLDLDTWKAPLTKVIWFGNLI